MTSILHHPLLGAIKGLVVREKLHRFLSLPYASTPQRFSRSECLTTLPHHGDATLFDATSVGPSSIQIKQAAHSDAESNQLPTDDVEEQEQDEDCLRLSIMKPSIIKPGSKLPVVVFVHGGAFFLGSGERRCYDPTTFCMQGLECDKPMVFVSINYRLGLLGFLHSPKASDLLPANNALHDQVRAFEWIGRNISGFGGDPQNVTALGQSAGGESLSLHNLSGSQQPLYRKSITLSGTLVTMPAKTPDEYHATFIESARKMKIQVGQRHPHDIAKDMLNVSIDTIRDANFVGAPCTSSQILPYDRPTMQLMRSTPDSQVDWLESHIVSSCTYDGSISYVITHNNSKRSDHARTFIQLARKLLKDPTELLLLYNISETDSDNEALRKICLFESDIGFVSATISQVTGLAETKIKAYLQIFDLGNPFKGLLPERTYASHTFDIVALLGTYEDRMDQDYRDTIQGWRDKILGYVMDGTPICAEYSESPGGLLVDAKSARFVSEEAMPGHGRRERLWALARGEKGGEGLDFLWESLCRRWLDSGE